MAKEELNKHPLIKENNVTTSKLQLDTQHTTEYCSVCYLHGLLPARGAQKRHTDSQAGAHKNARTHTHTHYASTHNK